MFKKIALLANLVTFSYVPNVNTTMCLKNELFYEFKKDLDVPFIKQEKSNYCVTASIQSILKYYKINSPSQNQIFEDLEGNEKGIFINQKTIYYLNNFFNLNNSKVKYENLTIPKGYLTNRNFFLFQTLIKDILNNERPILFASYNQNNSMGHAMVLKGIKIDKNNLLLTKYLFMDPAKGNIKELDAREILKKLEIAPLVIISENMTRVDIKNKSNIVDILNEEVSKKIYTRDTIEINKEINLSEEAGVNNLVNFKNRIKQIEIPDFEFVYWKEKNKEIIVFNKYIMNIEQINDGAWNTIETKYLNWRVSYFEFKFQQNVKCWKEMNGDFYLSITIRIQADVNLTSKGVDTKIYSGNFLKIDFK